MPCYGREIVSANWDISPTLLAVPLQRGVAKREEEEGEMVWAHSRGDGQVYFPRPADKEILST